MCAAKQYRGPYRNGRTPQSKYLQQIKIYNLYEKKIRNKKKESTEEQTDSFRKNFHDAIR